MGGGCMKKEDWEELVNFKPNEFEKPEKMDFLFLLKLDAARKIAKIPFVISSSYRQGDPNSHGRGLAVDIKCSDSPSRFKIVSSLLSVGFNRVGIYDKHIHVDSDTTLPQNVMWWDESK